MVIVTVVPTINLFLTAFRSLFSVIWRLMAQRTFNGMCPSVSAHQLLTQRTKYSFNSTAALTDGKKYYYNSVQCAFDARLAVAKQGRLVPNI